MLAPIDVTLTDREVANSARVAKARVDQSESMRLADAHGYVGPSMAINLPGAAGEAAFCKALGLVWTESVGTFKLPDASYNIQIRTAPCRAIKPPAGFGTLIVRHDDDDRDYFALVVGNIPHFRVMGWLLGVDAKRDKWLKCEAGRPAAWFVPAGALHQDFNVLLA